MNKWGFYGYNQAKVTINLIIMVNMAIKTKIKWSIDRHKRRRVKRLNAVPYQPIVGQACPRCQGYLYLEQVEEGYQLTCLNCGLRGRLYEDSRH